MGVKMKDNVPWIISMPWLMSGRWFEERLVPTI